MWTHTHNLDADAKDAWKEMHATWNNRVRLKRDAGASLRGRDNTNPVLHMTLSWHADDNPTPEHMKEAALSSLESIGLDEHQALIVAHSDKKHPHVHMVINTVHPQTGKTAALKYSKERLSRWAEAYEKEYGIHCEQRIENNEKRDKAKSDRKQEANELLMAGQRGERPPEPAPYVPIKDQSPTRPEWFERQEIIDRMKAMRARFEQPHALERSELQSKHRRESSALWKQTRAALERVRKHVKEEFRPKWRELYKKQNAELAFLSGNRRQTVIRPGSIQSRDQDHGLGVLSRARYVVGNRKRLAGDKPELTLKDMLELVLDRQKLISSVSKRHEFDRRNLARIQGWRRAELSEGIRKNDKAKVARLASEQRAERQAQWDRHKEIKNAEISFHLAKDELIAERATSPRPIPERQIKRAPAPRAKEAFAQEAENQPPKAKEPFKEASTPEPLTRAQQIERDMAEWRKRNKGRDQGREL